MSKNSSRKISSLTLAAKLNDFTNRLFAALDKKTPEELAAICRKLNDPQGQH